jgi:hypothetical protein
LRSWKSTALHRSASKICADQFGEAILMAMTSARQFR